MKTIAFLTSILLLTACASSTGFSDSINQCAPGQEVGVEAGLHIPRPNSAEMSNDREGKFLVQVSNNSHAEFTVTRLRVEQLYREDCPYEVDDQYRSVNVTIPEGKDHLFELPTSGRWKGFSRDPRNVAVEEVVLGVTVELTTGAKYHCRYSIPLR